MVGMVRAENYCFLGITGGLLATAVVYINVLITYGCG